MTKDKVKMKFEIDPAQGHLLRNFHREMLTGTIEQFKKAYEAIFEKPMTTEAYLTIRTFLMSKAAEWGSPDLTPEGMTTQKGVTLGVIEGGKA